MIKQCGTCRWWDRDNKELLLVNYLAPCLAPFPESVLSHDKSEVQDTEGRYCNVYEELE